MKLLLLFFAISSVFTLLSATKFTDCGSTSGQVSSVEVTGCPDSEDVCPLKKGTKAGITINFSSKADSKSLRAVVHGVIKSVPIPFPLPQSNACKSGVTCPVTNGKDYTYENNLNIRNSYPAIGVTVRWELRDENNNDMVCVEIPCEIQ